jgi:hypothetical protein
MKCKECVWFIHDEESHIGSCVMFGNKELIKKNQTVFDDLTKTKIPLCEVGENFGCINFESK